MAVFGVSNRDSGARDTTYPMIPAPRIEFAICQISPAQLDTAPRITPQRCRPPHSPTYVRDPVHQRAGGTHRSLGEHEFVFFFSGEAVAISQQGSFRRVLVVVVVVERGIPFVVWGFEH